MRAQPLVLMIAMIVLAVALFTERAAAQQHIRPEGDSERRSGGSIQVIWSVLRVRTHSYWHGTNPAPGGERRDIGHHGVFAVEVDSYDALLPSYLPVDERPVLRLDGVADDESGELSLSTGRSRRRVWESSEARQVTALDNLVRVPSSNRFRVDGMKGVERIFAIVRRTGDGSENWRPDRDITTPEQFLAYALQRFRSRPESNAPFMVDLLRYCNLEVRLEKKEARELLGRVARALKDPEDSWTRAALLQARLLHGDENALPEESEWLKRRVLTDENEFEMLRIIADHPDLSERIRTFALAQTISMSTQPRYHERCLLDIESGRSPMLEPARSEVLATLRAERDSRSLRALFGLAGGGVLALLAALGILRRTTSALLFH